ncbi:hypothetical protein KBC03_07670 [Patescibacteria group bacterium]|nr:hypothetical protein [Patescibacteria group bacterium]
MTMETVNHQQRTKCEIYTRVMGYYRPVSHFNIGKKSEFYSRNYFIEGKNEEHISSNEAFNNIYTPVSCS